MSLNDLKKKRLTGTFGICYRVLSKRRADRRIWEKDPLTMWTIHSILIPSYSVVVFRETILKH